MEKHLLIWKEALESLEKLISEINSNIYLNKNEIDKLQKQVYEIREDLRYMELDDRRYELDRLNGIRKRIDDMQGYLNNVQEFAKSPYFARINCKDTFFISRSKSEPDKNIYSFTSPIATLRFRDVGEAVSIGSNQYKVIQKDTYKINDGKLLWLEHADNEGIFDYDGNDVIHIDTKKPIEIPVNNIQPHHETVTKPIQKKNSVNKHELKNRKLTAKDTNGLTSIAELMKEEQDKVMRASTKGVTLISGSAGSGKTNIAIHRMRYLLNEFPNQFRKDNIGIFCFNVSLRNYLMNLINELELDSSNVFSYDEWLRDILIKKTNVRFINYTGEDESVKHLKTRKDVVTIIEHFLEWKKHKIVDLISQDEYLGQFKNIIKNINTNYLSVSDLTNFRSILQRSIKDKIKKQKDKVNSRSIFNKIIEKLSFNNNKEENTEVQDLDVTNIIDEKLRSIIRAEYCEDINWKDNNIGFNGIELLGQLYDFDEFKSYMGNNKFFSRLVNNTINSSDSYILGYILSLIDKRIFNEKYKSFDHIVIDEVQDFTPIQVQLLLNISNNSLTLSGDVTQKIFSNGIVGWDEIGVDINSRYELNMTHRASLETVLFANGVLKEAKNSTTAKSVGKRGPKPVVMKCNKGESIVHAISQIKRIQSENPHASIAIVYPTQTMLSSAYNQLTNNGIDSYIAIRDKWEFKSKIAISTYYQIKGLEFDYIIILGLNFYENSYLKNKENVLYTVITRAKERVFINYEIDMPRLINKIDRNLYESIG